MDMAVAYEQNTVASTWSGPLPPPADMPSAADVVIIGGGIVGVSTAWFLARAGIRAVLCEKGHIAGEQSSRNWGWVRQQGRALRVAAIDTATAPLPLATSESP